MPTDAQRRANAKQDAARAGKRVQLWLEPKQVKQIDNLKKLWALPSRAEVIKKLLGPKETSDGKRSRYCC